MSKTAFLGMILGLFFGGAAFLVWKQTNTPAKPEVPPAEGAGIPPVEEPPPKPAEPPVEETEPTAPTKTPPEAVGQSPDTVSIPGTDEAAGLDPKPTTVSLLGTLQINSSPWAEVLLAGELLGTTPLKTDLEAGEHTLVLRPLGSAEDEEEIMVTIHASETVIYSHPFSG